MDDEAKLLLKEKVESRSRVLASYDKHDDPLHPAWTFLLRDVVKSYGVCPYLNIFDDDCNKRRMPWVTHRPDGGEVYFATVRNVTDASMVTDLEQQISDVKTSLDAHVRMRITAEILTHDMTFDAIIENVLKRRDAKSQNKKAKDEWTDTLRCFDSIATNTGINFAKYVQVHTGYHFKYRTPAALEDPLKWDQVFVRMYDTLVGLQARLSTLLASREKEITTAKKHLATLIDDKFQIEQRGRYFRRWSSLSDERKDERIASYCDWFMRKGNYPIAASEAMKEFILDALTKKELKIGRDDLDWNGKQGIIINIPVTYDVNSNTFRLIRQLKALKKKRPKKTTEDIFFTDQAKAVQQRAHRLLLLELVKTGNTDRERVTGSVLKHLHTRVIPESTLRTYLLARCDDFVEMIRSHPIGQ